MKIKRKLLIALLSVACMTTGVVALSSCKSGKDARDQAIVAIYNQYASANENPLSYEDWLASVINGAGSKGEAGKSAYELYLESVTTGTPLSEAEWMASLKGESGKGVSKVELNADGTKLVINYTDGSSEEVDLPDGFHKHTYGETVTIIEPTNETEGVGVKVCSEDGHTEVVVISKLAYTLKFKNADGTPAAGLAVRLLNSVNVILDSGTTDENGELYLNHFGKKGKYIVRLEDTSLTTLGTVVTSDADSYDITVAKSAANGISEGGYYAVTVKWVSSYGMDYVEHPSLRLRADREKDTHFKLSVDETFGDWLYNDYASALVAGSVYDVNVSAGTSRQIYYSFDGELYDQETYPTVSYLIKAEITDAPARGTDVDIPLTLSLGDNAPVIETADKVAYFVFRGSQLEDATHAKLTFGEGVTVQLYAANSFGSMSSASLNQISAGYATLLNCESGEATPVELNTYGDNYFRVTADEGGNASIKVEKGYARGSLTNPYESAAVGDTTTISGYKGSAYATFTPAETKTYTIVLTTGYGIDVNTLDTEWDELSWCGSVPGNGRYSLEMTEGTTYYLSISMQGNDDGTYSAEYLIREYNEATDTGYAVETPRVLELTENKAQTVVGNATDTMYYQIKNLPEALGRLKITVLNSSNEEMTYTEYVYDYLKQEEIEQIVNVARITYMEDANDWFGRSDVSLYREGGNALLRVYLNFPLEGAGTVGYDGRYTIVAEFVPIVAVDHTFTVKNGETTISGVTVELYDYESNSTVATGTTDEHGVVTLNFVPGVYAVRLSELDETTYIYATTVYTDLPDDGSKDAGADYDVEVLSKVTYTYTATYSDGRPVAGLVVTLADGVTATTDENGVATFDPVFPDYYSVTFSEYSEDDYQLVADEFDAMTLVYSVTLLSKVNYTVTVNDAEGNALSGITVTITDTYGNIATGTTDDNGTVTLETGLVAGVYSISCSGEIPEGYVIKGETVSGLTSVTLTATPIQYGVFDGTNILLTAEEQYYKVDANNAGTYYLETDNSYAVAYLNGTKVTFANNSGTLSKTVTLNEGDVLVIYTTKVFGVEMFDTLYIEKS